MRQKNKFATLQTSFFWLELTQEQQNEIIKQFVNENDNIQVDLIKYCNQYSPAIFTKTNDKWIIKNILALYL